MWVFLHKSLFETLFDEIVVSDVAITSPDYNGLSFFYVNGENKIGFNQFDIFMNQDAPIFSYFKNNLGIYFYDVIVPKFVNFFSDDVMERYEQTNVHKNEEYNLATLCKECHLKKTLGKITINGYKDSLNGKFLDYTI